MLFADAGGVEGLGAAGEGAPQPCGVIPLRFQDRKLGVFTVLGQHGQGFSRDDAGLLASIGRQVSIALENSRLYTETQRKAQEFEALYQVSRAMASTLNLQNILTRISETVSSLLRAQAMSLMLLGPDGRTLSTVAGYNLFDETLPRAPESVGTRVPALWPCARSARWQILDGEAKNTFVRENNMRTWQKVVDGERVTEGELESLKAALKTIVPELQANPWWTKLIRTGEHVIGGSRALISSMDISAAGRQALYASVTNPKEMARAFKDQISALRMSRPEFETYMKTLMDPTFNKHAELAEAAGLHITKPHELDGMVEEAFINPTWAEKIPGVRRTEQAYIAYLNKLSSTATSTVCRPAGRISSTTNWPSAATGTARPATHTLCSGGMRLP